MLNSGHDITCQVCNILIEYRRTDENKEDTIRDHYLNLHSGDIFCNPKETVRLFFVMAIVSNTKHTKILEILFFLDKNQSRTTEYCLIKEKRNWKIIFEQQISEEK